MANPVKNGLACSSHGFFAENWKVATVFFKSKKQPCLKCRKSHKITECSKKIMTKNSAKKLEKLEKFRKIQKNYKKTSEKL